MVLSEDLLYSDAVAGHIIPDPISSKNIPKFLHMINARENYYSSLLKDISCILDPLPYDPCPTYTDYMGANFGCTVEVYNRAGGIPPVHVGEDRAFFEALKKVDAKIRHEPRAPVVVSGRLVGRAEGGMADTISSRILNPPTMADDRFETVDKAIDRIKLRRLWNDTWSKKNYHSAFMLSELLNLNPDFVYQLLNEKYCGIGWSYLEQYRLPKIQFPLSQLDTEISIAENYIKSYFI